MDRDALHDSVYVWITKLPSDMTWETLKDLARRVMHEQPLYADVDRNQDGATQGYLQCKKKEDAQRFIDFVPKWFKASIQDKRPATSASASTRSLVSYPANWTSQWSNQYGVMYCHPQHGPVVYAHNLHSVNRELLYYPTECRSLYFGNLAYDLTATQLRDAIMGYGTPKDGLDKVEKKEGFAYGFASFLTRHNARDALEYWIGKGQLEGRKLIVRWSKDHVVTSDAMVLHVARS